MVEINLVVDQLKLTYEGLFDLKGFYRMIDALFREKRYDKWELKNEEQVLPTGRDIDLIITPWRTIASHYKFYMRIKFRFMNVKDVEIEKHGEKLMVNQGTARIIIDAYIHTDFDDEWESNQIFYFIKTLYDKFIYKKQYNEYKEMLIHDVQEVHTAMQRFLNLYKYEVVI